MCTLTWILIVLSVLAACTYFFVWALSKARYTARRSDAIIIPGARVRMDWTLSNALRYRLDGAMEAFSSGLSGKIIVCGGRGRDEPVDEAFAMREYLIQKGVSGERIYMDRTSDNTIWNLKNAREIMRKNGMKSALIVTSDYHLARALFLARRLGIDASGVKTRAGAALKTRLLAPAREAVSWLILLRLLVFHPSSVK